MERFAAILDGDPVWASSVPLTLKQKIIEEVDLNQDGVVDYEEFLTLVRGKHLGLGQVMSKAKWQIPKHTS